MMETTNSEFCHLGIKEWLIKQCLTLGIKSPSPVQRECIPSILDGKHCIGSAKTGSGKTFAFALPILQHLSDDPYGIFALVLTPTHELAQQIGEQFSVLGRPMNLRVCVVTGGKDQIIEGQALSKRPHIVVAMPGRLSDHLTGCDTFSLRKIKYLVIDEADRLLSGSYDDDIRKILQNLSKKYQTLLFSATVTDSLKRNQLFTLDENDLFAWSESTEREVTVSTLDQRYVICPAYARDVYLVQVLNTYMKEHRTGNIMIFTTTKKDCQVLSVTLNNIGIENVCLHGYMKQRERVNALSRFRSQLTRVLIATNVAARGLDIPVVQLVVNHKMPLEPDEYVHRVGRTARAGRSGLAISLITPYDLICLGSIEEKIKTKLTEFQIDDKEAAKIFTQVAVTKREAEVNLDNEDFNERAKNYRRKDWILKGLDPDVMEAKFLKQIKLKRKERRKENMSKLAKLKSDLKIDGIQNDSSTKNITIKSVNKEIMKKDERFKNIPRQLKKIKADTEKNKHLGSGKLNMNNREQKIHKKRKKFLVKK